MEATGQTRADDAQAFEGAQIAEGRGETRDAVEGDIATQRPGSVAELETDRGAHRNRQALTVR